MRRQSACQKNDDLVRKMVADGATLTEIAHAVGTNRTRVRQYIERHNIPHQPYRRGAHLGEQNNLWKGGRVIDQDGYILVKHHTHPYRDRHDYVREHRLVMEQILGRYLDPKEVVHHRDRNKQNNHPDNLKLYRRNGEHLAEELKGKAPNWTPDGLNRMRIGILKSAKRRRKSSPSV